MIKTSLIIRYEKDEKVTRTNNSHTEQRFFRPRTERYESILTKVNERIVTIKNKKTKNSSKSIRDRTVGVLNVEIQSIPLQSEQIKTDREREREREREKEREREREREREYHVFLKRGKEERPKTACLSSPHTLRQYAQGTHDAVSGIDRE